MRKRITVYLEDTEIETLKKIAFIQRISMAELICRGVRELCNSYSKKQNEALAKLTKIKAAAKIDGINSKVAMSAALKAQKQVRRERKASRR